MDAVKVQSVVCTFDGARHPISRRLKIAAFLIQQLPRIVRLFLRGGQNQYTISSSPLTETGKYSATLAPLVMPDTFHPSSTCIYNSTPPPLSTPTPFRSIRLQHIYPTLARPPPPALAMSLYPPPTPAVPSPAMHTQPRPTRPAPHRTSSSPSPSPSASANLSSAYLSSANLSSTNLSSANLSSANLSSTSPPSPSLTPSPTPSTPPSLTGVLSDAHFAHLHRHLQMKWVRHGPQFTLTWMSRSREARRSWLMSHFPQAATSSTDSRDAFGFDARINAALFPELVISEVVSSDFHLPGLFAEADSFDSFEHMLEAAVAFCAKADIRIDEAPDSLGRADLADLHTGFDVAMSVGSRPARNVDEGVVRAARNRCATMLLVLCGIFSHWEGELKETSVKESLLGVLFGCSSSQCARHTKGDGGMLKTCHGCRISSYCSRECQKVDWERGHNVACCFEGGDSAQVGADKLRLVPDVVFEANETTKAKVLECLQKRAAGQDKNIHAELIAMLNFIEIYQGELRRSDLFGSDDGID